MKRKQNVSHAASYARMSTDLQRHESLTDQQRRCREFALERNGHEINPRFEFVDEAVSGTLLDRAGLNALLESAKAGLFNALYFFSLSRLARESVITMPVLKLLVHVYKVRVVSVTEGVDSDRDGWEMLATLLSLQHERYLKELAENVFKGQEGNVFNGFSNGDYCFGYASVDVPGTEQHRRGRHPRPRRVYIIDHEEAAWVMRIFEWFVTERRSLRWIARELNRLGAPKDHRASTKVWRHNMLPPLLRNPKYVGIWPWGRRKTVRNPLDGSKSQEDRPEAETEKWTRQFTHLRIIGDEMRARALTLLDENDRAHAHHRKNDGTLAGSGPASCRHNPRHLLSLLVHCGECGSVLNVGGPHGKYLFCPGYHRGTCSCKTQLRRDRAERMILDAIGKRILLDAAWRQTVLDEAQRSWHVLEKQLPSELAAAKKTLSEVRAKTAVLLEQVENGIDVPELKARLAERSEQQKSLSHLVAELECKNESRGAPPDAAWVDEQLSQLHQIIAAGGPAAAHALHALVGKIVVTEIKLPGRDRHYLQGRFSIPITGATSLAMPILSDPESGRDIANDEVVIDFRDVEPQEYLADEVKRLFDQGKKFKEIAEELNCGRALVRKAFEFWHTSRGMVPPDGRSLKKRLPSQRLARKLVQSVKDLWDQGLSYGEIARKLQCDRNVVTEAVKLWFSERNLPIPDGRTRRKQQRRAG